MSVNTDPHALRVFKFGGSSLGRVASLSRVLEIVESSPTRLALVVSAFGSTTDWLLEAVDAARTGDAVAAIEQVDRIERLAVETVRAALAARGASWGELDEVVARELAPLRALLRGVASIEDCSARTRDRVLAFGEMLSAAVVAGALRALGTLAERVDARTWIVTDERHGDASVQMDATRARASAHGALASEARVAVHTGFLGATPAGVTTTLGRNGSDYTAAVLAAVLGAAEVVVWTDVSGVMTADPDLVAEAYPVPALSYREALELAGLGLRMLHPRTVLPLLDAGIPMRIRNTMRPDDPGTLVSTEGSTDEARPTCVASLDAMALVDVEGTLRSGGARIASRALSALAAAEVPVLLSVPAAQGNGVAFVVPGHRAELAEGVVSDELARERAEGAVSAPRVAAPVSIVTLVAEAMGRTTNVAGRFFGALGAIGVNVKAASQGATSRAISCVVDGADTAASVQAVHAAFNLATEQVNVLLLGKGTVGGAFLSQIASEHDELRERHDVDLRLAGVADSRASWFDERSLDPRAVRDRLAATTERDDVVSLLDRLKRLPVPVLVDCTAADGMHRVYEAALSRGIHVVTANKKALAVSSIERDALFAAARRAHRALRYETTVGASLPVIETLQNLVRTGDRVHLIEGSLSGTLGYLSNEVSQGVRLSTAIRAARERGYTEPHPRDDLSGTDAARKALILAREVGLTIDFEDLVVEPFVPAHLLAHDEVEPFLDAIAAYDDAFERRIAGLRAEGRVLRYLATVTPLARRDGPPPVVHVGPVAVANDHPAARLRGTEALVAFRTERYSGLSARRPGGGRGRGGDGRRGARRRVGDLAGAARGGATVARRGVTAPPRGS